MRTTVVAIAFAVVCTLAYVACNGVGSTNPEPPADVGKGRHITAVSISGPTVQNAGILHNQGLAYLRGIYNLAENFSAPGEQAKYLLANACGYYRAQDGWDSAGSNTADMQNALVSMLNRRYPSSDAEAWAVARSTPVCAKYVPPAEVSMIDNAISIVSMPSAAYAPTQISASITSRADSLINVWNSIHWGSNQGELAGGLLYLMKGSASYWRDHPVSSTESPHYPPDLAQLVQVDCVGYLYGWLAAVSAEITANGHLDVNNQYKRIHAGIVNGVSWSMGGAIRGYFGL